MPKTKNKINRNKSGVQPPKKRNKKPVQPTVKKVKASKWDDLITMSKNAGKIIQFVFMHYQWFLTHRADIIANSLPAKESVIGLGKMINDHLTQLQRLAELHTLRDENGNLLIAEDGRAKFKRGPFKTDKDRQDAVNIVIEYMNEIEGIEPLLEVVLPETASKLGVPQEMIDAIHSVADQNAKTSQRATLKMADSVSSYNDALAAYHQEVAELNASIGVAAMKLQEGEAIIQPEVKPVEEEK